MNIPDLSHDDLHESLNFYVEQFSKHQKAFQAHLLGKVDDDHGPLPSTFFSPASYWTSDEKDAFFHGLAIYSRLRPESIAEHIKTKSTLDVCVYLEALERGLARAEDEGLVEPLTREHDFGQAMEVSSKWIGREEGIAETLLQLDVCPWNANGFLDEGTTSKRPRGCTCLGRKSEAESDFEEDEDEDTEEWGSVKKNNLYLRHLDPTGLMMLESILRDAQAEASHNGDNGPALSEEGPSVSSGGAMSQQHNPQIADGEVSHPGDSAAPNANGEPTPNLESGPSKPSEVSVAGHIDSQERRKLLNRLYMRRKRAEAKGGVVNSDFGKLRPGRHKKPTKTLPRPATYKPRKKRLVGRAAVAAKAAANDATASADEDEGSAQGGSAYIGEAESMHKQKEAGQTRPVKMKTFFTKKGVSAEVISNLDLDFFHLSTFARLLRLFNSMHDPTRNLDDISLSVECLPLLRMITKEFVSAAVRRAITIKEQEVRLKSGIKVWKYGQDEISGDNMRECLNAMELPRFSKEAYTIERFGAAGTEDADASEAENSADDQDVAMVDYSGYRPDTLRKAAVPSRIPQVSLANHANLTYCDLFTATDDVISHEWDEANEAAMQKGIQEEEEIETRDKELSLEYEYFLCKELRVKHQFSTIT